MSSSYRVWSGFFQSRQLINSKACLEPLLRQLTGCFYYGSFPDRKLTSQRTAVSVQTAMQQRTVKFDLLNVLINHTACTIDFITRHPLRSNARKPAGAAEKIGFYETGECTVNENRSQCTTIGSTVYSSHQPVQATELATEELAIYPKNHFSANEFF